VKVNVLKRKYVIANRLFFILLKKMLCIRAEKRMLIDWSSVARTWKV